MLKQRYAEHHLKIMAIPIEQRSQSGLLLYTIDARGNSPDTTTSVKTKLGILIEE